MNSRFQLKIQNGSDITTLSYKKWYNEYQIPKATIIIVHGIADHINRYNSIANTFVSNGFSVYGLDLREHGENINVDIQNYTTYISDLEHLIKQVIKDYPKNKIILIGQGFGSLIVHRFCQLYPDGISGIVLSGTKYNNRIKLYFKKLFLKILKKIKSENYNGKYLYNFIHETSNIKFRPARTEFDWINQNEAEVDAYINDKLCGNNNHLKITTYNHLLNLSIDINKNIKSINKNLNVFIINGENDSINNFSKFSKKLKNKFNKLKMKNIIHKTYKTARHEIFLENNKEEVYSDILSWISQILINSEKK